MNNPYKISSFILVVILTFYAVRASLQVVDQSGDTGIKMDIVEPQDGVSLDPVNTTLSDGQSLPDGVENFGLSVGEAGQGVNLTLGEPETPTLLDTSSTTEPEIDNIDNQEGPSEDELNNNDKEKYGEDKKDNENGSKKYYYFAHWEWKIDSLFNQFNWQAPYLDKNIELIDLRSIPQSSQAGGNPQGYGLFVYSEYINDPKMFYLGNDLNSEINNKDKIATLLSIDKINSDTIVDILWEILTIKADPTGQNRVKPIMPTKDMTLEFYLDGLVKSKKIIPFESPEWDNIQKVLQEDYREIRTKVQNGLLPENTHRKTLKFYEEKYKIDYRVFIPPNLPDETPIVHGTKWTDDFNRADNDSLGANWTERCSGSPPGDIDISSNRAVIVTSQEYGVAHTATLSNADYEVQSVIRIPTAPTNFVGIVGRRQNYSTVDSNGYFLFPNAAENILYLYKQNGTTWTLLDIYAVTIHDGIDYTINLNMQGSSLIGYIGGVEGVTATDSTFSTAGDVGLWFGDNAAYEENTQWDDFFWDDWVITTSYQPRPPASGTGTGPAMY